MSPKIDIPARLQRGWIKQIEEAVVQFFQGLGRTIRVPSRSSWVWIWQGRGKKQSSLGGFQWRNGRWEADLHFPIHTVEDLETFFIYFREHLANVDELDQAWAQWQSRRSQAAFREYRTAASMLYERINTEKP